MQTQGTEVAIEFSVTLDDGTVVESTQNKQPLRIHLGNHEVLPAIEEVIKTLSPGSSKQVKLSPEQAYGPLRTEDYLTVELNSIPASRRQVGSEVTIENEEGERFTARVHEVKSDLVILDLNHPLAGKTLIFDVKRLDVH